jgi:hypothetical protein
MWCLSRLTPHFSRAVRLMLPAAALSAFSATPPISSTIAELAGTWEGQMLLGSNWRYVGARFGAPDDPGGAQVDLPQERRQFRDFTVSGARLTWTLVRNTERIEFEGTHVLPPELCKPQFMLTRQEPLQHDVVRGIDVEGGDPWTVGGERVQPFEVSAVDGHRAQLARVVGPGWPLKVHRRAIG